MLDRWLKLFPRITPLVLLSMLLRACACAATKMYIYLSLLHTHTYLVFFEIHDLGYVVLVPLSQEKRSYIYFDETFVN